MKKAHRETFIKKHRKSLIAAAAVVLLAAAVCISTGIFFSDRDSTEDIFQSIRSENIQPGTDRIVSRMTLEEKVAQMFLACFYSGTPSPDEIRECTPGGVLLFGASFSDSTPAEVRKSISALNSASSTPPFIAVDEEGGTVVRVSSSKKFRSTPFLSPRELYAKGGLDLIISDAHEKNTLLSGLGINLDLAPVCDISTNKKDFMYDRSLGQDARITSDFTEAVVKACAEDSMGCTLKHFPGYGDSADTHKGIAVDRRSMDQLKSSDLLPFQAGIDAGAPSVLVSHNIVRAIDADAPASLSPAVHRMLREDIGFRGVIITDDLSMDAIDGFFPEADSAVTAVLAGNDMLCTGSFHKQYDAVLRAVRDGNIPKERIDQSVRRIISWKISAGLIDLDR